MKGGLKRSALTSATQEGRYAFQGSDIQKAAERYWPLRKGSILPSGKVFWPNLDVPREQ